MLVDRAPADAAALLVSGKIIAIDCRLDCGDSRDELCRDPGFEEIRYEKERTLGRERLAQGLRRVRQTISAPDGRSASTNFSRRTTRR